MTDRLTVLVAGALVAATAPLTPAGAQSLGEIARREAARRANISEAAKVYSNDELTPDFSHPPAPEPAPAGASAEPGDATADGAELDARQADDAVSGQPAVPRLEKGEDYWRGRANLIRARIDGKRAEVEALQQRVDALAGRGGTVAAQEREVSAAALTKARSDLAHFEEEWAGFAAGARAMEIPVAWIQ